VSWPGASKGEPAVGLTSMTCKMRANRTPSELRIAPCPGDDPRRGFAESNGRPLGIARFGLVGLDPGGKRRHTNIRSNLHLCVVLDGRPRQDGEG
jgi:hypothetical protein